MTTQVKVIVACIFYLYMILILRLKIYTSTDGNMKFSSPILGCVLIFFLHHSSEGLYHNILRLSYSE